MNSEVFIIIIIIKTLLHLSESSDIFFSLIFTYATSLGMRKRGLCCCSLAVQLYTLALCKMCAWMMKIMWRGDKSCLAPVSRESLVIWEEELKQMCSKTAFSVANRARINVALYSGVSLQTDLERNIAVACSNLGSWRTTQRDLGC
jgi:hypothetical protein